MRIYLSPALLDWIIFLVTFAVLYSAGEREVSLMRCAWIGGSFQIAYMLSSLLIGFILNHRNARPLLLVSTVICTLAGIFCLLTHNYLLLITGMIILSFSMAVFFNAFQTFMRGETIPGGLGKTVSIYNFAWSMGAGGGALSAGLFYRFGPYALSGITFLVGTVIMIALLTYQPKRYREKDADMPEIRQGSRAAAPIYVVIGWLIIFTSMFIQRPLHNFFPRISAEINTSASLAGMALFMNMLIQGLTSLAMYKLPSALYRRAPLILLHGLGIIICLMILWKPTNIFLTFAGIGLLGICAGAACYLSVYFASNSGNRSLNVGINEFLVGLGSFAGLFAVEQRMNIVGHHGLYQVFAACLAISLLLQVFLATLFPGSAARKIKS